MKFKRVFYFLPILLLCSLASADQEFYGIRMRNELWAKNLVLNLGPKAGGGDESVPLFDKALYAEAILKKTSTARTEWDPIT